MANNHHSFRYRSDIDGLRAVAVLLVLIFHAFPEYRSGGYVGVDVFFVISGFLITKIIASEIEENRFSIKEFYTRRVLRIFPALIVVLAGCYGFGWLYMLAEDFSLLSKHIVGGGAFFSNLLLWHEAGYFDKASDTKPLLHLWSLGVEEQFYLAWPLLLWVAFYRKIQFWKIIAVVLFASFLLNIYRISSHPIETFYSPLSRAWELMLGAALTLIPQLGVMGKRINFLERIKISSIKPINKDSISIAGFLLIIFSALFLNKQSCFPGWWALLPTMGAFFVIAAGPNAWTNRVIFAHPILVSIGLISFPLYLWHWPLLVALHSLNPEVSVASRFGVLICSVLLAWITYCLIEKPFRFGRWNKKIKVTSLAISMVAMIFVGGITFRLHGLPSRYPEYIQKATEFNLDVYREKLRNRKCFMDLDQDASQYSSECIGQGASPLWVLWGDSGAAAIYPGIHRYFSDSGRARLAQFTSSQCPPILGFESKANASCKYNNDWTIETIKKIRPDVVVLSAIWFRYDIDDLNRTITEVQKAGVRKVVIFVSGPEWIQPPSHILLKLWKEDPLHRLPPARLDYKKFGAGNLQYEFSVDARLSKLAKSIGATHISLFNLLCNDVGCLTRESDASSESFYHDIVHLSHKGAEFLAGKIAEKLVDFP